MPHISKLLDMQQWKSMPIYMSNMNWLASTMWPGVSYTDYYCADANTNADPDNKDDNVTRLNFTQFAIGEINHIKDSFFTL